MKVGYVWRILRVYFINKPLIKLNNLNILLDYLIKSDCHNLFSKYINEIKSTFEIYL